ncbi:UV DNA damage endonuclease [Paenibacillus phyllosphaerae]|uniref:UV DNA damage endonuclease n=1 Tax=Paenibacillus phyllosphaerae TaxID=274593 RepID=A0A7W5FPP4_9BACL|nr:UV DNA damage repair endonuclease UvsE [Paenibacillus phyllosphaerae]MBB3112600.1 UV DNA damage endonuclease [Paenibacillus phyllosphaerae]
MIVRFGFVAMTMLLQNASPSKTMTFASFTKLADREAAIRKLERIAEENLHNTLRVIRHAVAHDIKMYRFSSKLIPLLTHEALADWSPWPALADGFASIGKFAKEKEMRVSFHPDHFCVFSTPRPEVLEKSKQDMEVHLRMLEAMGLPETAKCNIHVGGAYGDKVKAGARFVEQFNALPERMRNRITLENDDKTFTARETLEAAEAVNVPMVLDIHHHAVNDGGETDANLYGELWPRILRSWQLEPLVHQEHPERVLAGADSVSSGSSGLHTGSGSGGGSGPLHISAIGDVIDPMPPKLHISSPKSEKDPRGHADNVEAGPVLRFLQEVAGSTPRLDCMIEAKRKDAALITLMDDMRQLAAAGERIRIIDGATIEVF